MECREYDEGHSSSSKGIETQWNVRVLKLPTKMLQATPRFFVKGNKTETCKFLDLLWVQYSDEVPLPYKKIRFITVYRFEFWETGQENTTIFAFVENFKIKARNSFVKSNWLLRILVTWNSCQMAEKITNNSKTLIFPKSTPMLSSLSYNNL